MSNATVNRPDGERLLDAAVVRFDLPEYTRKLMDERIWENTTRNSITLLHNDYMRIVLVVIKGGQEMCHGVERALSIQVLSGRVNVETDEETFSMDEGEMAALRPRVRHFVFAEKQAVVLLTLGGAMAEGA